MGMISKKAGGTTAVGFALGAAMMMAQPASAAVLDFVGLIDNVTGEQAVEKSTSINPLLNATYMPIATTAFGYSGTTGDKLADLGLDPWAYLDSGGAGIGVCTDGLNTSRQCTDSADDNVQRDEVLGLSWGVLDIEVSSLSFRAEGHNTAFNEDDAVGISFDSGETWSTYALAATSGVVSFVGKIVKAGDSLLMATTPEPTYEQFYLGSAVVSQVPLPAGVLLLGSALGGLGVMGRRRKAA